MERLFCCPKISRKGGHAMPFDYYREESEQLSFFRIPRLLIMSLKFARLPADAKLLYGLFLSRIILSTRNERLYESRITSSEF